MSEETVGREYDRWLQGRSLSARGYAVLTGLPGLTLVNTPVYRFERTLALEPEHRVLDIGCGRAALLLFLASRIAFSRRPVGIDLSASMLQLGRRERDEAGLDFTLLRGSAIRLPLAGNAFDVILSSYVVKHLDDADLTRFLAELLRVLRPGGFAVVWEFAPSRSRRLDRWHRWLLTRGVRNCILRPFEQLAAAATRAGFDWVENAHLRPFLFPPIPRVSLVLGKAPEGWRARTGPGRARRRAASAAGGAPHGTA